MSRVKRFCDGRESIGKCVEQMLHTVNRHMETTLNRVTDNDGISAANRIAAITPEVIELKGRLKNNNRAAGPHRQECMGKMTSFAPNDDPRALTDVDKFLGARLQRIDNGESARGHAPGYFHLVDKHAGLARRLPQKHHARMFLPRFCGSELGSHGFIAFRLVDAFRAVIKNDNLMKEGAGDASDRWREKTFVLNLMGCQFSTRLKICHRRAIGLSQYGKRNVVEQPVAEESVPEIAGGESGMTELDFRPACDEHLNFAQALEQVPLHQASLEEVYIAKEMSPQRRVRRHRSRQGLKLIFIRRPGRWCRDSGEIGRVEDSWLVVCLGRAFDDPASRRCRGEPEWVSGAPERTGDHGRESDHVFPRTGRAARNGLRAGEPRS